MSDPFAHAGEPGRSPSGPALPRMSLAVAAALLVHLALLADVRLGATASLTVASAAVPMMRVREIALPVADSAARAEVEETRPAALNASRGPTPPVATPVAVAKPLPAPSSDRVAAPAVESAASMPARVPAVAASSTSKPDAAERTAALPPAPDYVLGATLDPGPQPIGEIEPEYPASANLQEGRVVIRVLISDEGRVDNVAVVRAAPPGLFEAAALEAFGKARFTPARAAGVPVKSQITVEVHFLPINRGARISGRSY